MWVGRRAEGGERESQADSSLSTELESWSEAKSKSDAQATEPPRRPSFFLVVSVSWSSASVADKKGKQGKEKERWKLILLRLEIGILVPD